MDYQPDIVVYHDKCMDGFTAAWAVWRRWGDEPSYVPRNYGMDPDLDCRGKHVLIVDFSFKVDVLARLVANEGAASVVILDHHKTAREDLEPFLFEESSPGAIGAADVLGMLRDLDELRRPPIIALFDMERSGAGMAWDFCFGSHTRPKVVDLVEDRDLWRFAFGDESKWLHLALSSGVIDFARWDRLASYPYDEIRTGEAIAAYRDSLVEEIVERAVPRWIGGKRGMLVDCPYGLASDVGNRLLDLHPAAEFAAAEVRGVDSATYSLRSRDDRADVSEIARKFGGGGHRNAAGFKVPRS